MTQPYPKAELSPPTRTRPPNGSLGGLPPEELGSWIDQQTARDPTKSMAILTNALRSVNGAALGYHELSELTQILLTRVTPVLGKTELQLRQLPIPLGRKTQVTATNYSELSRELEKACLRLVDETLAQRILNTRDAGLRLRQALLLLAGRCLHFWRFYQPLPPNTWLQLYRVLELAEHLGIARDPASDTERMSGQPLSPDSVENLVARIAVLGSSGVYALHHGEAGLLARWLESVPVKCMSEIPADSDDSSPMLLLLLHEDRAPSLVAGRPATAKDRRLIDLRPLVDSIRSGPAGQGRPGTSPSLSGGLGRRLLKLWVVPPTRRFSREPADVGPLITVTGLKDIHAVVREDYRQLRSLRAREVSDLPGSTRTAFPYDDPQSTPSAMPQSTGYFDESPSFEIEAPDNGYRSDEETRFLSDRAMDREGVAWNAAARGINPRFDATTAPRAMRLLQSTPAQLRELGAGGVRLLLKAPVQKIFTGDLIAIRATRKGRVNWQVGTIRWLCYSDDTAVTVGIEYLAPSCTPTEVRHYRSNTVVGKPNLGLFFHPHGKPEVGALVFAPGTFTTGGQVSFHIAGEQRVVRLESVRPESHTFSRADFRVPPPL